MPCDGLPIAARACGHSAKKPANRSSVDGGAAPCRCLLRCCLAAQRVASAALETQCNPLASGEDQQQSRHRHQHHQHNQCSLRSSASSSSASVVSLRSAKSGADTRAPTHCHCPAGAARAPGASAKHQSTANKLQANWPSIKLTSDKEDKRSGCCRAATCCRCACSCKSAPSCAGRASSSPSSAGTASARAASSDSDSSIKIVIVNASGQSQPHQHPHASGQKYARHWPAQQPSQASGAKQSWPRRGGGSGSERVAAGESDSAPAECRKSRLMGDLVDAEHREDQDADADERGEPASCATSRPSSMSKPCDCARGSSAGRQQKFGGKQAANFSPAGGQHYRVEDLTSGEQSELAAQMSARHASSPPPAIWLGKRARAPSACSCPSDRLAGQLGCAPRAPVAEQQPGQACYRPDEAGNRKREPASQWSGQESELINSRLRLFEQRPSSRASKVALSVSPAPPSAASSTSSSSPTTTADEDDDAKSAASSERRARQKLTALFSQEQGAAERPTSESQPRANLRSASRCPSVSSASTASRASSSNAALSDYTCSSISLARSTAGQQTVSAEAPPAKELQKTTHWRQDENNNSQTCPDAYATEPSATSTETAPASPPPPPPPPPPPAGFGEFNLSFASASGKATLVASSTLESCADHLRLAVERRLLRSSGAAEGEVCDPKVAAVEPEHKLAASAARSSARSGSQLHLAAAPVFIPPQFSAPPKDGTNIKPSEYLKRVNSNSTLVVLANSAQMQALVGETETETETGDESAPTSSSSGVGSKSSTPIGSLSSSTGASLISRSSLNSASQGGGAKLKSAAPAGGGSRNRFKQLQQRRSPFLELKRSQSTSALNQLDCDEHERAPHVDKSDRHEEMDDPNYETDESASQCSSAAGTSATVSSSSASARADFKASPLSRHHDGATSNLMSELRNFDRSKLLRNTKEESKAASQAPVRDNKLEHLLDATKRDLIAELKESKDLDGIKRMREFSKNKTELSHVVASAMPVFKVEDFLDRVAEGEPELPMWRRQMLAKKAADRARKEHEEKLRVELEERRLSQVPQWKRQMLAKKAAERKRNNTEITLQHQQVENAQRQGQSSEMPMWRRQLVRSKITASTGNISTIVGQTADSTNLSPVCSH